MQDQTPPPAIRIEDLLSRMKQTRKPTLVQSQGAPSMAVAAFAALNEMAMPKASWQDLVRPTLEKLGIMSAPTKSPRLRATLEEIDSTLLLRLHKAQFLHEPPVVSDFDSQESRDYAYTGRGWSGHVNMASSVEGERMGGFLKGTPEQSHTEKSLSRWMVLLHEAAHCEFEQIKDPFSPSRTMCSVSETKALNTWVFAGVCKDNFCRDWLNECFADCYGAMMLMEATGHSSASRSVIHDVLTTRKENRELGEEVEARYPDFRNPHQTDRALAILLDKEADWQGKPPSELRSLALRYASHGLLELAEPRRLNGNLEVGRKLRDRLGRIEVDLTNVAHRLRAPLAIGLETSSKAAEGFSEHPLGQVIDQLASAVPEMIKAHAVSWRERVSLPKEAAKSYWKRFFEKMGDIVSAANAQAQNDPGVQQEIAHALRVLDGFSHGPKPLGFMERLANRQGAAQANPSPLPRQPRPH